MVDFNYQPFLQLVGTKTGPKSYIQAPLHIYKEKLVTLIFQFPIYLEPGVDRYLIYWRAWELSFKYIGYWKMRDHLP